MQVTSLTFTQDNNMRNTLQVNLSLVHVPRSQLGGLLGAALDVAVGVGSALSREEQVGFAYSTVGPVFDSLPIDSRQAFRNHFPCC